MSYGQGQPAVMLIKFTEPPTNPARAKDLVERCVSDDLVCEARFTDLKLDITLPAYAVRWPVSGRFELAVDGAPCPLDDRHFLITNPDQRVTASWRSERESHVLIAIVSRQSMKRAFIDMRRAAHRLLRSGSGVRDWPVHFDARSRTHTPRITPVLREIQRAALLDIGDEEWLDRQINALCERMLFNEHKSLDSIGIGRPNAQYAPAVRLRQARFFLEEHYSRHVTVADAANEACMSPHHFLREFKRLFGETPHRYLTRKRLEVATDMLGNSSLTMAQIAERVGFRSVNGFHRAFRQRYGCPPAQLRSRLQ